MINHSKDEVENDLGKDLVTIFHDLNFQMVRDCYNRKKDIEEEFIKNSRRVFFEER